MDGPWTVCRQFDSSTQFYLERNDWGSLNHLEVPNPDQCRIRKLSLKSKIFNLPKYFSAGIFWDSFLVQQFPRNTRRCNSYNRGPHTQGCPGYRTAGPLVTIHTFPKLNRNIWIFQVILTTEPYNILVFQDILRLVVSALEPKTCHFLIVNLILTSLIVKSSQNDSQ